MTKMPLLSDIPRDDDDKHVDDDWIALAKLRAQITSTDHNNSSSSSSSSSGNISSNISSSSSSSIDQTNGGSKPTQSKVNNRAKEYADSITNNAIANTTRIKKKYPFLISRFAFEIYIVLALFLLVQRYWILYGITFVFLFHIADILFLWFIHVKEAKEIRQFKGWLLWWIRIGLDFATRTVEGEVVHRVLTAYTLNFWNIIGKKYTISWFDDIAKKGRTNVLNQAKETLNQTKMTQKKFTDNLRDTLKRKSG